MKKAHAESCMVIFELFCVLLWIVQKFVLHMYEEAHRHKGKVMS